MKTLYAESFSWNTNSLHSYILSPKTTQYFGDIGDEVMSCWQ
jgi:hypothetical protein